MRTDRGSTGKVGKIGQVYLAAGQHYVLLRSGLSTVGPVMQDLLLASGGNATSISANAATAAVRPRHRTSTRPDSPPRSRTWRTRPPSRRWCARSPTGDQTKADWAPKIVLHEQLDGVEVGALGSARNGPDGVRLADHVTIPARPGGPRPYARRRPVTPA